MRRIAFPKKKRHVLTIGSLPSATAIILYVWTLPHIPGHRKGGLLAGRECIKQHVLCSTKFLRLDNRSLSPLGLCNC